MRLSPPGEVHVRRLAPEVWVGDEGRRWKLGVSDMAISIQHNLDTLTFEIMPEILLVGGCAVRVPNPIALQDLCGWTHRDFRLFDRRAARSVGNFFRP